MHVLCVTISILVQFSSRCLVLRSREESALVAEVVLLPYTEVRSRMCVAEPAQAAAFWLFGWPFGSSVLMADG